MMGAAYTRCAHVTCVDLHGAFLQGKARWDKRRRGEQVTPLAGRRSPVQQLSREPFTLSVALLSTQTELTQ